MVDSYSAGLGRQHSNFRYFSGSTTTVYADMRHSNKTNQLYVDTHVKASHDDDVISGAIADGDLMDVSYNPSGESPAALGVMVYKDGVAIQIN